MSQVVNTIGAVIFDWAGTTVDYGSIAPVTVFREIFRREGVEITTAEAREPMGRGKHDHIATIAAMPRVAAAWQSVHGAPATPDDVLRMYEQFLPLQKATLCQHADIIPGACEVLAWLRARGIKIGSTTGYTRALMAELMPLCRAAGFAPDNVVCADDVAAGRPAPWMLYQSAEALGVYPLSRVVAVDDTLVGIEAGRHAGAWTVGVAKSGNALGLSAAEIAALAPPELEAALAAARQQLAASRPDFIIDTVADLPAVIEQIEARLQAA